MYRIKSVASSSIMACVLNSLSTNQKWLVKINWTEWKACWQNTSRVGVAGRHQNGQILQCGLQTLPLLCLSVGVFVGKREVWCEDCRKTQVWWEKEGHVDGNRRDTCGGRLWVNPCLGRGSPVCWELMPWPAVRARRSSSSHSSAGSDQAQVCSSCRGSTCTPCWDRAAQQTQPAGRCPTSGHSSPRLGALSISAHVLVFRPFRDRIRECFVLEGILKVISFQPHWCYPLRKTENL